MFLVIWTEPSELATLLGFMKGVREVSYKDLWDQATMDVVKFLQSSGFASDDTIAVGGRKVSPWRVLLTLLSPNEPRTTIGCLIVNAFGTRGGRPAKTTHCLGPIYYGDVYQAPCTAYSTAIPASIAAQMLPDGLIGQKGGLPPEAFTQSQVKHVLRQMRARGFVVKKLPAAGWTPANRPPVFRHVNKTGRVSVTRSRMSQEHASMAPHIVVKPPGPRSRELLRRQEEFETGAVVYSKAFPFAIDSAENATIRDVDGNLYIDWVSGISVLNLGHCNPVVTQAVASQLGRIWHALEIPTETRIGFLERMHSVLPGGLRGHAKIMTTVTGADACETAVSIARRVTGKKTIVAFEGAYHGVHAGAVSLTSSRHYLEYSGVSRQGVFRLPYPYAYRFPLPVEKKGDEGKVVLRYLEHLIEDEHSGLDDLAGIIVEPIEGEGGYILPPEDFLPGLREIANRSHIPLIVDEVQTGFGRTGKFWGCELTGTTPDIMCVSKSVGAGIPLSLVAYKSEYDEKLGEGFHLGTYRGNLLAMAAGSASIGYIKGNRILERVARLGTKTKEEFERTASKSKSIGDVRGVGFMIGNEVVESKQSRKPSRAVAVELRKRMFESGLLMHTCGHYGNVLRFMAPLTIEEPLLENGLEVFERTVISHGQ